MICMDFISIDLMGEGAIIITSYKDAKEGERVFYLSKFHSKFDVGRNAIKVI